MRVFTVVQVDPTVTQVGLFAKKKIKKTKKNKNNPSLKKKINVTYECYRKKIKSIQRRKRNTIPQ